MSRFYQRYLTQLKDAEKADDVPSTRPRTTTAPSSSSAKPDPTAMVKARPQSSRVSATNIQGAAGGPAVERRVQIFNKSETYAPDANSAGIQTHAKSEPSKEFLRSALRLNYLFEELSPVDVDRIIDGMKPVFAGVGDAIIKQNDIGDLFYCLENGMASASVDGKEVHVYESGGCFGELALIYNSPRAATVTAVTACRLWALELKVFRYILATTSSNTMMTRCGFLKKCPFLDPLNNDQISKLAGALEESTFSEGQLIVRQGDVGTSFFIIEEGNVKCTQVKTSGVEVNLITLKSGDYFGEMALMLNETRHANVYATDKTVKVLTLDKDKFELLLGDVQELLAKRMRIRILQSVPLLAKLPEVKLAKLSSVMRVQAFTDGQYILKQGEEGSRFYIINEGEVKCTQRDSNGTETELIKLRAQEFFGEKALITNEPRKANVIACGSVECLVLDRSSFQTLLAEVQDDLNIAIIGREKGSPATTSGKGGSKVTTVAVPTTTYTFADLKIMRTVGTGTFGRVKLVQHKANGNVYALKCMNKVEVLASHQERNIMNEKNLLLECSGHPLILTLFQTFNSNDQICMLMEFIQGGELWSLIYEKTTALPRCSLGGFELDAAKFYAANVVLVFKHLAEKKIAYRDLKPENLLIANNGYLKMIDFGFAKKFPYTKNEQKFDKTYTLCGTPEYLAPEIVMSKGYDASVDYWALGCLIYELSVSKTPFQADYTNKIFQNIVASEKCLQFSSKMDASQVQIVKKLLTVNPAFRLGSFSGGVNDIMKEPFFASVDWPSVEHQQVRAPYKPTVKNALDTENFDQYDEETDVPNYTGDQAIFAQF